MRPYLKSVKKLEEFRGILDVAMSLFRGKEKRDDAEKELVKLGKKAVRPLAYAIELSLQYRHLSDSEINERADIVSEAIAKIGKKALPDLEDFATNGSCNIFVNEWAQLAIFRVMNLNEEEKQKACHHFGFLLVPKEKLRLCPLCGLIFKENG